MPTSLISRIKKDNFIIFKSANEDIELFGRTDKKFRFSHFALLDLPDLKEATNNENVLDFTRIQSRFITGNSTATPPAVGDAIDLSESFQNYLLNFEDILTSTDSYNRELVKNTNERLFFKWLKEVGAVRFKTALTAETNFSSRYTEENDNSDSLDGNIYSKVVKYLGEINFQNKTTNNKNNFEEVLLMIPSFVGNTPTVLFKTIVDDNYQPLSSISREDVANAEFINGYDNTSIVTNGLELLAQYDIDVQGLTYTSVNDNNPSDTSLWFDYFTGVDAYLTDKTFSDATNDLITADNGSIQKTFLRSRLDGIVLDLDKSSYAGMNQLENRTFSDFASVGDSFNFNAILVYYELEKNGVTETNLFGVMFLGDVAEISGGTSTIQRIPKIKQSALLSQTGNGFSFKLNFRIDATDNNIVVDVSSDVNDYNVFSMHLFSQTMGQISKILVNYDKLIVANADLLKQNEQIMSLLAQNNTSLAQTQLKEIFDLLQTSSEFNSLADLIAKNSAQIDDILKNKTVVDANVILDVFGIDGIKATLDGVLLKIGLSDAEYSTFEAKPVSHTYNNQNEFQIGKRNKLINLSSDNTIIVEADINLYLDDSFTSWKTLQSVTLLLDPKINFGGKLINIFTDKKSLFTNQSYGLQIASFEPKSNMVKIVCSNEAEYKFIVA